jgi:WD40 repeat protein
LERQATTWIKARRSTPRARYNRPVRRHPPAILALLFAACLCPGRTLAQDKQFLARLPGPSGTAVEFSRDGKFILTAGGDEVRVWDANTFQPLGQPIRHPRLMVARRADRADVLLTVAADARLWDVRTGKPVGEPIEVPAVDPRDDEQSQKVAGWAILAWPAPPWPAVLSPDGARFAVTRCVRQGAGPARWDVEVWEVTPRRRLQSLRHDLRPAFVSFTPDGRRLLTAEPFDHRPHGGGEDFRLWDLATGGQVCPTIRTGYNYDAPECPPAAFSPDGSLLAVGAKTTFSVHDGRTGEKRADSGARHPGDPLQPDVSAITFSADGRRVLVQSCGWFRVWDAATVTPVTDPKLGHDAAISADGRRVAAASYTGESRSLVVWDVGTGAEVSRLPIDDSGTFALSPDGKRVAAAAFPSGGFTGVWAVDSPEGNAEKK